MVNTLDLDLVLRITEIFSIIAGGTIVAFKIGRTTEQMTAGLKAQTMQAEVHAREIKDLKNEVKNLTGAFTRLAVQEERLNTLDRRYDELASLARR